MLIDLYYIGLFFVASVCVYAIIYSRTNRSGYIFPLYPQCLLSVWTWQAIYVLQGTPRPKVLPDEDVEVL